MKVYTYILKDLKRNLYKIGQSTNPKQRFRQLCIPGELIPIYLFDTNIEGALHKEYAEYRLKNHPKYIDGKTEYFSYGGRFAEFVNKLDVKILPFYSPHNLYLFLETQKLMRYDSAETRAVVLEDKYAEWRLGRKILVLLGYLFYDGYNYASIHRGIELDGSKTFISSGVVEYILNHYRVDIVASRFGELQKTLGERYDSRMYTRKLNELPDGTTVFLVVTQIK